MGYGFFFKRIVRYILLEIFFHGACHNTHCLRCNGSFVSLIPTHRSHPSIAVSTLPSSLSLLHPFTMVRTLIDCWLID
jgi:hypothetical protein